MRVAAGAALLLVGCASPSYRNYTVPESLGPIGSEARAGGVELDPSNSELLPGGIRLVTADVAPPAPPFRLRDEDGTSHTNASLHGRVVWIDLWAEWCGTCRAEFPRVQSLHERYERNGLTILAVCRNSTPSGFRQAVEKDWIDFAAVDASEVDDFPFPYAAFPTSVVLDRAGRVRAYWRGHRSGDALEGLLRQLLAEPAGEAPLRDQDLVAPLTSGAGIQLRGSDEVVKADLSLKARARDIDGYFHGSVVIDVDPGWHLTAAKERGLIPLSVRLADSTGVRTFDRLLPPARPDGVDGGPGDVHLGRVAIPVWGTLEPGWPADRPLTLEIVTTLQACDATVCLAPVDIVLSESLWIEEPGTR